MASVAQLMDKEGLIDSSIFKVFFRSPFRYGNIIMPGLGISVMLKFNTVIEIIRCKDQKNKYFKANGYSLPQ